MAGRQCRGNQLSPQLRDWVDLWGAALPPLVSGSLAEGAQSAAPDYRGGLLAWAVLVPWMDIGWGAGILPFAAAVAASAALSVLAGISVSLGALARRPAEVLRAE